MAERRATKTVTVTNQQGVHARAATMIAELVRRFDAQVLLTNNSRDPDEPNGAGPANGSDVLHILSLVAKQGDELSLEARGSDADEVLEALVQLFVDNFRDHEEETP